MKNLEVLISKSLFIGLAFLMEVRQGISRTLSFSLRIIDSKIVLRELFGSADLTRAQTLCIYKLAEVIMVSKDKKLVFAAF